MGKCSASFLRWTLLPKRRCVGGSVSFNPYLVPDSVHLVKHIYDKRQLSKIGALSTYSRALSVSIRESLIKQVVTRGRQLTKVVLCAASLGTVDPFPHSRPWDESSFKAFFPG